MILPGLQVPNLTISVDWDSGLLEDNAVTFKIVDSDGETLPRFWGQIEKEYRLLGTRLSPREDPAPAVSQDQYGDALTLWDGSEGCYLGLEAIGPNGERHYYSCLPWLSATWPGEDHGVVDDPLPVHTTMAVGPYIVEGRRVALFRLVYDEDTGTWPSPQDQYEGGTLLWWGKLRSKGKAGGRTWTISCSGPASWLVKTLNSRGPAQWYKVGSSPSLPASQRKIKLRFFKKNGPYGFLYKYGEDTTTYSIPPGPLDLDTIVSAIQTAVMAVKSAPGDDGVWTDEAPGFGAGGNITFLANEVAIWSSADGGFSVILTLSLHWSIWRALGYDPEMGLGTHDGPQPQFSLDVDDPKYYNGSFSSTPFGQDVWTVGDDVDAWDGDGAVHVYTPMYPGGLVVLPGTGHADVKLIKPDGGFDPIYCESQMVRPPYTGASFGGLDCNATRWWVFKGKIQRATGPGTVGEPEDFAQVAKCSWVETTGEPGLMYQSDGLNADLHIEEWADPRLWGFNNPPIDPEIGWAGTIDSGDGAIYATPLAAWSLWTRTDPHYGVGTEHVAYILLRILQSTGTASWDVGATDPGDAALWKTYPDLDYLLPGVNHPTPWLPELADAGDADIADLGLAIPRQMVSPSRVVQALQLGSASELWRGKIAGHGPVESEDLLLGIIRPRDLAFGIEDGKYILWRRTREVSINVAPISITISDLAGEGGDPASTWPEAELRGTDPLDRVILRYCADPTDNPTEGTLERPLKARDLGSRARAGRSSLEIQAPDLRAREWWQGEAPLTDDWSQAARDLWEQSVPGFLAKSNRRLTLRVSRPKGQNLYPGVLVALTDPRPLNSSGGYGYTNAVARVISVTHEADSCAATVDLLVQAAPATQQVWAPVARVVDDVETLEERYDAASRTFFCRDTSSPGDEPFGYNLSAFVEPQWSTAGGNARFWVLQYDGTSWVKTCEGNVESVDVDAGTLTHTDDGLVGTFYGRMYAYIVMAPYDDVDQVAWPKSVFALLGPPKGLPESKKLK